MFAPRCGTRPTSGLREARLPGLLETAPAGLDLYLIHWPTAYEEPAEQRSGAAAELVINLKDPNTGRLLYSETHFTETWLAMEDVREVGLARSIGLSHFNHVMLDEILAMPGLRCKPSLFQMELHPYLSQERLHAYCTKHEIVLNAYCPLGAPNADWLPDGKPKVMEDPLIGRLAERHGKSRAQIILRYHVQRSIVPIPKSNTPSRIRENLEVFDFSLSEEEMQQLLALNKNIRYCLNTAGEYITDHPLYPFHEEY